MFLQARDDGTQQIIVILMMVIFGIFNLLAGWLKKRSGQGGEDDHVIVFEEDDREVHGERRPGYAEVPEEEPTLAGGREEDLPWWEVPPERRQPLPAPGAERRPPRPVQQPERVVVRRPVEERAAEVRLPAELPAPVPSRPAAEELPAWRKAMERVEARRRAADAVRAAAPVVAGGIGDMESLADSEIGGYSFARRRSKPRYSVADIRHGIVLQSVLGQPKGLEPRL